MKKYWLGLRYGNKRTKSYLWGFLLLILATIICIGITIITKIMEVGAITAFLAAFTLIFGLNLSFGDVKKQIDEVNEKGIEAHKSKEKKSKWKDEIYNVQYSEKKIKQLFHQYKVKKGNKPVIVDSSKKYKISQCPAYIWIDKGYFYLLLLEKKPRKIEIEVNKMDGITYKREIVYNLNEEYQHLKDASLEKLVYQEFLPTYHRIRKNNMMLYTKNLYVLINDITFTNKSAKNLFEVYQGKFQVQDLNIERFGEYFKEIYQFNLLWKDGVYSTEEYKKKVQQLLNGLVESNLSDEEVQEQIYRFMKYNFITEEYADFYLHHREKIKNKTAK